MNNAQSKIMAILEVASVFFLTFLTMGALYVSPLGQWERRVLQRTFFEYILMITLPVLLLIDTRRNLATYGISFKNLKYHLNVALTCFLPVAVASVPRGFLDWRQKDGALVLVGVEIVLLFALAWLLRNKPPAGSLGVISVFLFLTSSILLISGPIIGKAISAVVFYLVFLGPGEEVLFRGYIQSRLNEAFGRPYRFFGVNWGWGIIITALLFGFMHVLNFTSLFMGKLDLMWWWGSWTFFSGLVLGFVREKTGSVVAPAILHGLPQAIASAFLGL